MSNTETGRITFENVLQDLGVGNIKHSLLESYLANNITKDAVQDDPSLCSSLSSLIKGNYEEVLFGDVSRMMLGAEEDADATDDVKKFIIRHIESFLKQNTTVKDESRELCVLCLGVACLQLFIQSNWTGPPCVCRPTDVLPRKFADDAVTLREAAMQALGCEDASVYSLVVYPEFLLMASCILNQLQPLNSACRTAKWWLMRCLWIHQQVLDERSPRIHEQLHGLMDAVVDDEVLMSDDRYGDLAVVFHLECSHITQYYYEFIASKEHLRTAEKISGLEVSLTGALGKRTRFQETDKPQLVLQVKQLALREGATDSGREQPQHHTSLPKDLDLNDDTLLEAIKFQDSDVDTVPNLTSSQQALVLALCTQHKRSSPRQDLLLLELKAYVVTVLKRPQLWTIQTMALLTRCQVERDSGRTVERAMSQMQVIVDNFNDPSPAVADRMALLHAVGLPPTWTMESELASLLMSLGVVTAALEVYIRLQLWEDVIKCYQLLEKPEKAVQVIREQLAIKETTTMLCLLGDMKQDPQYYHKAWELSNHRSAKAMRCLGLYYLNEENWQKSVECLEISLQKNSIQYKAWFWLGYAATQVENYESAARAFRKCVTLESDNGKAWNNLSSAYVSLKQKPRAFKTLQESIRLLYENWRTWENYMLVSVDIGEFGEAIRSFHRLLDLKEKYVEEDVLTILVRAVTENIMDADDKPAQRLKGKLTELFGKLTAQVTSNATVWRLYAKLYGDAVTDDPASNDKALQFLQKAHRLNMQQGTWSHDIQSCQTVLSQSLQLARAYTRCSSSKTNTTEAKQLLSSAKLMLKSVISQTKMHHPDDAPTWSDISEPLSLAEMELQAVVDRIAQMQH